MDSLKKYIINFAGLSIGEHIFSYNLNNSFFENFEYSEVQSGNLDVQVNVFKQERMIELDFFIRGNVEVECSRCLDKFLLPIEISNKLLLKMGNTYEELTDEAIIITENDTMFNIAQYIYEFIIIALPIKRVHPIDKFGNSLCDKEMLEILENIETKEVIEDIEDIDPRWEVLKNLKFN